MILEAAHDRPNITAEQMRAFLSSGWGELGERIFGHFNELNDRFFAGSLAPMPICVVPVSPYGHWAGLCCGSTTRREAALIYLCVPRDGKTLVADRGVLLHEMLHAHLMARGDDPQHSGQAWRDEIVRLSAIAGRTVVARATKVVKDANRKSMRVTPEGSLTQREIASWPHSIGLKLGRL